jgi:type IV secretion system T-DNA border endonuclease VirD2
VKYDRLEIDPHGRKSGLRRLTWHDTKDGLRRLVERVPEVVIKVEGGGLTSEGIKKYMAYMTRNGQLPAADDKDDPIKGKDGVANAHDRWDLDMTKGHGRLHQSFNLILSMPKGTNPNKLFIAVQRFASEHLSDHDYMMVLHTPETDPKQPAPNHPHVHLALKAEDRHGQRIQIRKPLLRIWRESFAAHLRDLGVPANATHRSSRGVAYKAKKNGEYRVTRRNDPNHPSTALQKRFLEAKQDLERGNPPKKWEVAMAARRRDVLRELATGAAKLRAEGDTELAAKVEQFAKVMPPLDTERHHMQRAIVEQLKERFLPEQQLRTPRRDDAPQSHLGPNDVYHK